MTPTKPPRIVHGDSLEIMRMLPDNSIDAVITDPPYGLSACTPQTVNDTLARWVSGERDYVPSGQKGFMGKSWDGFVPPPAFWDEALRVLKPGGHLLSFAGSRTQDLMGMSIRLAGFEIRESLYWHYGSGFPKSLDVGKAIDRARDEDAEPRRNVCVQLREALDKSGKKRREIDEHFGTANVSQYWFSPDRNSQVPPVDKWAWVRDFLNIGPDLDAEVWRLNGRKGTPGEDWDAREVIGSKTAGMGSGETFGMLQSEGNNANATKVIPITAPATPAAQKWSGFGTALKPATEPIIMARKPMKQTVASNVQEWGTGAINVDGCRVGTGDGKAPYVDRPRGPKSALVAQLDGHGTTSSGNPAGRWPANVILDEHMAAVMDGQSGVSTSPLKVTQGQSAAQQSGAMYSGKDQRNKRVVPGHGDTGGASRFFKVIEPDAPFVYMAKAPKKERPVVDGIAHPTVKPVALMRWLVRLVTPPGGTVLEPFAGSGTTVEACILEGFHCIAIEREAEYLPLIQARIDRQDAA